MYRVYVHMYMIFFCLLGRIFYVLTDFFTPLSCMLHFVHFSLGDSAILLTQVNILSHVRVSIGSRERKKPVYCFCAHTTVYVCAGGGGGFFSSTLPTHTGTDRHMYERVDHAGKIWNIGCYLYHTSHAAGFYTHSHMSFTPKEAVRYRQSCDGV